MYIFPFIFVQCFCLIYIFLLPPILTMMHLSVMLYTYWTPLFQAFELGQKAQP